MLLERLSLRSTYATSLLSNASTPKLATNALLCPNPVCPASLWTHPPPLPLIFQTGLLSCFIPSDFALGAIAALRPLLYAHGTSIFPSQS